MSRSFCTYDEDWQRRKSVLIRSLFHDIPILSPVEEESNDSSHDYYVPAQEAFPSPQRPYSPLPPLIIEKVPVINKHDEPEEYYRKLHKKITRIYKKLFIEKRNLGSVDFDSNCNDSSVNDDSEEANDNLVFNTENNSTENGHSDIEEGEASESSASSKSNGYGADFESMDTAIIDVVNHTVPNEDIIMISEEELEREHFEGDGMRYEESNNLRTSGHKESSLERMEDDKDESHHSTIHDEDTTESEELNENEVELDNETEFSDNEIINKHGRFEETPQITQSNIVKIVVTEASAGEEVHHSTTDNQDSDKSNEKEYNVTETDEKTSNSREVEESKEENKLISSNDEPMEEDVETSQSSGGPYYRQITTQALIHFDGYQDHVERESRVYEDSVKSIILPTRCRRVVVSRNVEEDRIEVLAELEDNADPKTTSTFHTDGSETTDEEIEEETTPNTDANMENDEPGAMEEDGEIMSALQSDPSDKEFEEMTIYQLLQSDDGDMSATQSGAKDRGFEEIGSELPIKSDVTVEDIEEWGKLESGDTDEENESMADETYIAGEHFGEMRPRLDTIEEDDEEMSTHHTEEDFEVDIEESSTPRKKLRSDYQPATTEKVAEAKRVPQTVTTIEDALEMETTHSNTTDEERTIHEEGKMTSQTDGTEEEIEEIGTPVTKKHDIRTIVPESTPKEMKTPQPADDDAEELESSDSIEQMRTPRPDLSQGTIPITHDSNSASSTEHTALPQELTALTVSTQDGVDNNMSELQTSNEINEILTSIINESRNEDGAPAFSRKRKLVDKSVQAVEMSRVTWEDIRANFFIGTPKIFRLCACTDHVCS